jgi:hypothetical protein
MGKIDKSAVAGALMLGAMAGEPALAQNAETPQPIMVAATTTSEQVTDCVAFVREQRDLASETNITMSRGDQKTLLLQCQRGETQARIADKKKYSQS